MCRIPCQTLLVGIRVPHSMVLCEESKLVGFSVKSIHLKGGDVGRVGLVWATVWLLSVSAIKAGPEHPSGNKGLPKIGYIGDGSGDILRFAKIFLHATQFVPMVGCFSLATGVFDLHHRSASRGIVVATCSSLVHCLVSPSLLQSSTLTM